MESQGGKQSDAKRIAFVEMETTRKLKGISAVYHSRFDVWYLIQGFQHQISCGWTSSRSNQLKNEFIMVTDFHRNLRTYR